MTRQTLSILFGAAALSLFTVACDSDSDTTTGAAMSGDASTGTPDDDSGTPPTTTDDPDPSATTTDTPQTTGSDDTTGGGDETGQGFIDMPDGGGVAVECDVWTDDCPEGEKCMPWANDGGSSWNATRCSPIDTNPGQVGDPCTVEGSGVSGVDSCDSRSMCYYVDPEVGEGICVGFCDGTPQAPSCDPGFICTIVNDGVLTLCRPECDPLLPQSCDGDAACLPASGSNGFTCIIDASGEAGAAGDPCEFINACDPGNLCIDASALSGCEAGGCCTEFCDTEAPDCSNPDYECISYYAEGMEAPGYETVGFCAIPA
jgi:hypothetical protein